MQLASGRAGIQAQVCLAQKSKLFHLIQLLSPDDILLGCWGLKPGLDRCPLTPQQNGLRKLCQESGTLPPRIADL